MTKKKITETENHTSQLAEKLAQLTEQSSVAGFEGLNELLIMLNEALIDEPQVGDDKAGFSKQKNKAVNNFFTLAKQHLEKAPNQQIINQLIESFKGFAEQLELDEEDCFSLNEMLFNDQAADAIDSSDKLSEERVDKFLQQLKQFSKQAEDKQLTGLQDILFLLLDWCDSAKEAINQLPVKNSLLQAISTGLMDYLSGQNEPQVVSELFDSFTSLNDSFLLEEDEISDLKQLLLADLKDNEDLAKKDVVSESADEEASVNNYREQLKLFLQQAETLELSGLQDTIYLLDEFLENKKEQEDQTPSLLLSCKNIVDAIQAYLSGQGQNNAINFLLAEINKLDKNPLLEKEDSEILKNVLEEESSLISDSALDVSVTEEQTGLELSSSDHSGSSDQSINTVEDSVQIPAYLEEYVDILSLVYLPIKNNLDKLYDFIQKQEQLTALDDELLEQLNDEILKLTTIAETADFIGLKVSSAHVQENLPFLKDPDLHRVAETIALLHQWSISISAYLSSPLSENAIHSLLVINCSPTWAVALEEEKAAILLTELQTLDRRAQATKAEERQRQATVEDVSLALPDDVSVVLVDSLLEELPEQTATFSSSIEQLSRGGSLDDVIVAQRVAHTLKGAGNTVGVKGIASLTHHLEDILTALADEKILPDQTILSTLQRASDCLEEMTETLTSDAPAPLDAMDVLQEVLDLAALIDEQGISSLIQLTAKSSVEADDSSVHKVIEPVIEGDKESSEQMIRLPVSVVDKLLQIADELTINNGQLRGQLKHAVVESKTLKAHLEQFHNHSIELLGLVDIQRIHQIQNQVGSTLNEDFDSLEMDQYNELYSTSLRIHEMTSDSREMNRNFSNQLRDIDNLLIEQGYLNRASQNSLTDIRTIPVQSIVSRLQRSVRQAARMTGKKVELHLNGDDLLVDRDILNGLMDPLMHLLRNAVSHGIEESAKRLEAGKPEQGYISLSFRRDRNMIAIDCIDDGGGLNLVAIKNKAIKKGIIKADSELSDEDLKQLIMQPNFSTEESVSQISGRGVGMDAVNSGIRALGGTLRLETTVGKGCSFYIQLPLSLAHHNCLLINIGAQVIALAELGIEQILLADAGVLTTENNEYLFEFEENKYAVKTIESLLSRVRPNQQIAMESRTFLLIKQLENYFAIAVESVNSVKKMIVKELSNVLPKIHGVVGASLLDDGSIAPVLDLQELLQEPARWGTHSDERFADESQVDKAYALVVDDSLSARRSLEQFFSDMGYQIMAAHDGLDAIEQLELKIPDIIITDLEMPRINGIELTEYVRRNEATKNLPIIMITSRATAKHKQLAEEKGINAYLTKPYSEELLSNTVLRLVKDHVEV